MYRCTRTCRGTCTNTDKHTCTYTMPCVQGMLYPFRASKATEALIYMYSRWGTENEGLRIAAHMDTIQREERKASDGTRTLLKPRDQGETRRKI